LERADGEKRAKNLVIHGQSPEVVRKENVRLIRGGKKLRGNHQGKNKGGCEKKDVELNI